MAKITFNPGFMHSDPQRAYKVFANDVTRLARRNQEISKKEFYSGIKTLSESFAERDSIDTMTKLSKNFAERLVSMRLGDLAGIVYSILIKVNNGNNKVIEELALNGLAVAKRFNDPMHIFARANDLNELYAKTAPGSEKHLKYLHTAHKALTAICEKYQTTASERIRIISRDLKPLENYEFMLSNIKLDIAKYIIGREPKTAIDYINSAVNLLEKNKNSKNIESLNILRMRVKKIKAKI